MPRTLPTAPMRHLTCFAALFLLVIVGGCASGPKIVTPEPPPLPTGGPLIPPGNQGVLAAGTQVVANTPAGRIKIEAGPGMRRIYNWDGMRRGAILKPRSKPFVGAHTKGLSFNGKPKIWAPARGITRLRAEEGKLDFDNMDDAKIWMQIRRLYYAYNNSGLVVGWKREGNTLHVELWQFYIDGKQPKNMPGAKDSAVQVSAVKRIPQKMHPELIFADGHTEPYNTRTAAEYGNAHTGGAAGPLKTAASSSQASQCGWFSGLFGKCTATDTADNASNDNAVTKTSVASASNSTSPTSKNALSASSPAAGDNATDSTANDHASSGTDSGALQARVAGRVVNIRSRPSTHSDVLLQARQGDSVKILKKDRGWRYVKLEDGRKGWVADFLLKH